VFTPRRSAGTQLCVSGDGELVAVGTREGDVAVMRARALAAGGAVAWLPGARGGVSTSVREDAASTSRSSAGAGEMVEAMHGLHRGVTAAAFVARGDGCGDDLLVVGYGGGGLRIISVGDGARRSAAREGGGAPRHQLPLRVASSAVVVAVRVAALDPPAIMSPSWIIAPSAATLAATATATATAAAAAAAAAAFAAAAASTSPPSFAPTAHADAAADADAALATESLADRVRGLRGRFLASLRRNEVAPALEQIPRREFMVDTELDAQLVDEVGAAHAHKLDPP